MADKQEEKLKELIRYQQGNAYLQFRQWFLKQFETGNTSNDCTLEEFALYYLNSVRQHTEVHLKSSGTETPKCQTPVRSLKPNHTMDESTTARRLMMDLSQQVTSTPQDSLNLKKDSLHISYNDFGNSHSTPRLSSSVDRSGYSQKNTTSTPIRRNNSGNSRRLSTTPVSAKSSSSSLCLGDFLVINTSTHNRSHKKKSSHTPNQQHTGQQQKTPNEKPKKRLQPISISKKVETIKNASSIFAGESSFSNDNNILKISNTELEDKEQCAILQARKSLRLNASEITKQMKDVSINCTPLKTDSVTASTPSKEVKNEDPPLDLNKLKNNLLLKRLAEIYAILIDLNLTTNILNELSFLFNLLNASSTNNIKTESCSIMNQLQIQQDLETNEGLECLEDLTHAVCFALQCLSLQKQVLSSLDTKSLSVVLSSERFTYLTEEVKTFLLEVHQRKQHLVAEKPFHDTSICFDAKPCNNVYFQEDQDSRQNFTSNQEFANFRAQRDLFCKCLKIWESNHLNPTWKFSSEIAPKIREIFQHSENCINMAHFAKLFVSQLLLSSSNTASPEEMGLDVDLQKFTKLTQRLVAPSQFSVDYQFPHTQAFFRDFIIEARSMAFAEQLKMELGAELISLNDSSFDHINISKVDNDAEEQNVSTLPCNQNVIVRPEILNSMLILAKFLGFTTSLPFNLNGSQSVPAQVEKKQIRLRSLMQPTFDICIMVQHGIEQGKLLITIPWIAQYFAMLDNVTLQLDSYMKALKVMFALYWYMGMDDSKPPHNSSLFIVRLCLGWLFESKQYVAEQYYNFRALINGNSQELTNELLFVKTKFKRNLEECGENDDNLELNPLLESILPVACPFLAEFRVSIMPAKYAHTKNASRTGRYRHITTRIAELPTTPQIREDNTSQNSSNNKPKQIQTNLIQAFLRSQNSSTRHIINFCIERCYKSVVKDGQLKILLPGKTNADNLVNKITSDNYRFVYNEVKTIYKQAHSEAVAKWKESVPQMMDTRIRNALDSLLPEETSLIIKKTYCMIIKKDTEHKISQWFYANMIKESFFCTNLEEMANKICSSNKNKVQLGSTDLVITKAQPSVSDLIDDLQYWLHCTSVRIELFKDLTPIIQLLNSLLEAFDNILPSVLYRLMAAGILQLLQHIIAKHNTQLNNELLEAACKVWVHTNMQQALNLSKPSKDQEKSESSSGCIFDALITVAFIESLGTKTHCYTELGRLISYMIQKQVISLSYTNQLFVSVFKHEWHPFVLKEISHMLRNIANEATLISQSKRCDSDDGGGVNAQEENDGKSLLFLDMLADLSRDVDFF